MKRKIPPIPIHMLLIGIRGIAGIGHGVEWISFPVPIPMAVLQILVLVRIFYLARVFIKEKIYVGNPISASIILILYCIRTHRIQRLAGLKLQLQPYM